MNSKPTPFKGSLIFFLVFLVIVFLAGFFFILKSSFFPGIGELNKIAWAISSKYAEKIDSARLTQAAIKGMVNLLDPYSEYLNRKDFAKFQEETIGEFQGIGIEIDIRSDTIIVIAPIEGTPGYKAGIKSGDKIVKVNGEQVKGWNSDEVLKRLRGEKGTKVQLTVWREDVGKTIDYTIIREVIEIKTVPYYGTVEDKFGYVRILKFGESTPDEVKNGLEELKKKNITGLILDLRGNPGGLLSSVLEIASFFLGEEKLILEIRGKSKETNQKYNALKKGEFENLPLVILVDQGSASASEILAGAIQDWDRGVIIGDTTFGKGLVQSIIDLGKGNYLKLTTAKYFIPSGRTLEETWAFQTTGKTDSSSFPQLFYTKVGRKVWGNGGIVPDIVIPQERYVPLLYELLRQNILFEFAVYYTGVHKNIIPNFETDEKVFQEFKKFLRERKFNYKSDVEMNLENLEKELFDDQSKSILNQLKSQIALQKEKELENSKEFIKIALTEQILTNLFGRGVMYEKVLLKKDKGINKAKEVLNNSEEYKKLLSAK